MNPDRHSAPLMVDLDSFNGKMKLKKSNSVHAWMRAIQTPTPYRVGTAKIQLKPRFVAYFILFSMAIFVLFIFVFLPHPMKIIPNCIPQYKVYNSTYPLSVPFKFEDGLRYKVAVITDLDTDSKVSEKEWKSYIKIGYITITKGLLTVDIKWGKTETLTSSLAQGGRGMELSELVVFNGRLYTVDDRTGVVYQIEDNHVIPWVILSDGNGQQAKGFKAEWATVRNQRLYVGGLGKEWTTVTGEVQNFNPQWVKSIGPTGDVIHYNWRDNYNAMRHVSGTEFPGYLIHESGVWSDFHNRWFFLPRRASTKSYDETADERRATNIMLICDEHFQNIEVRYIGDLNLTHGFSSFKFIPGTEDNLIIALKSMEDKGRVASFVLVFTVSGEIIYPEAQIGDHKFEGIEFV